MGHLWDLQAQKLFLRMEHSLLHSFGQILTAEVQLCTGTSQIYAT